MDGGDFAFHDLAPSEESFRDAVLAGLGRTPKTLPCKFFYDARGSALFEEICEVPEYYLTRTEIAIMRHHAREMASLDLLSDGRLELGIGAGWMTADYEKAGIPLDPPGVRDRSQGLLVRP